MSERTSIIKHKESNRIVIIREDYLEICDNDHCMAALLGYYEYKINALISVIEDKKMANKNYMPTADDFFIQASPNYVSKGLLGLFSKNKIRDANDSLLEKNYITIKIEREKDSSNFLPTMVSLNIDIINNAISTLSKIGQPPIQNWSTPLSKNGQPPYPNLDRSSSLEELKEKKDTSVPDVCSLLDEIKSLKNVLMENYNYENNSKDFIKYYKIAESFRKQIRATILEAGGSTKQVDKANIYTWVDPIRLMYEQDEIKGNALMVIHDNLNKLTFWKNQILSTKKLREKSNVLLLDIAKTLKIKPIRTASVQYHKPGDPLI